MWLILFLACTGTEEVDTASGLCADAPVVTYETFGAGFMTENCQSCHASTSPDRQGAPSHVVFDTVDDVWANKERVIGLAVTTTSMPPLGGTTEDDRAKLEIWLTCAEEGT